MIGFLDVGEIKRLAKELLELSQNYTLVKTTTVVNTQIPARTVVEYSIKKSQGSI